MSMYDQLSGTETVEVRGFAIAYYANLKGEGYEVGSIGGPQAIQAKDIPGELHEPILALIKQHERKKWDLVEEEEIDGQETETVG